MGAIENDEIVGMVGDNFSGEISSTGDGRRRDAPHDCAGHILPAQDQISLAAPLGESETSI